MLYDSRFANLTDEQREKLRKLAWTVVTKGAVSFAVAVFTELGKRFVEKVTGDDEEDDDEEPEA